MSMLQIFQLVLPLITYPYLIRVLGKEIYGVVVFSNAIIVYVNVFIDFGFNISEIREISIWRDHKRKVSEIVSTVILIKLFFAIVSFIFLIAFVIYIPKLNEHKWLYFASIGMLIDTAINPRFYFQGIEKMKFITILNLGARSFFLIMIFILVKQPSHYFFVPLMTSIGAVISSLIGLLIIYRDHGLRFIIPTKTLLTETIKNSFPFFSSRLSVLVINKTNIVLIGAFIGYGQVAYYDLAEKLVSMMKMPFNIFNQVLFPNVSKTKNIRLVSNTLKILLVVYIIGYLLLFILSESIIVLIANVNLLPAKPIIYILGITAITELISVFLGAPTLLALGYKREYNGSIIWGSVFYIAIVLLLYMVGAISIYTLTITTVVSSAFIMIYRLRFCKKYKLM